MLLIANPELPNYSSAGMNEQEWINKWEPVLKMKYCTQLYKWNTIQSEYIINLSGNVKCMQFAIWKMICSMTHSSKVKKNLLKLYHMFIGTNIFLAEV